MRKTTKKKQTGGLSALKANPRNPRKEWDEDSKEAFARSLAEFGDLSGVILNTTTGQLVGGHKRVAEFRKDAEAQVIITDRFNPADLAGTVAYGHVLLSSGVRFAYREVEWSEDKEALANLAANRWGAEWDWQGVSDILKGLDVDSLDLSGFSTAELEPLIHGEWELPGKEELPKADEVSEEGKAESGAAHVELTERGMAALRGLQDLFEASDFSTALEKAWEIVRAEIPNKRGSKTKEKK